MPHSGKSVRTETQVSAGGAAFRRIGPKLEVALVSVGTPPRWQLPKGLIDDGESPGEAAEALAHLAFKSERGIVEKAAAGIEAAKEADD